VTEVGRVRSTDGTEIAWVTAGRGRPLVVVPGTTFDADILGGLAAALEDRFSCSVIDRRGRGRSADSELYSIDAEYEDVSVVVAELGKEVAAVGHSFGAICALEAARRTEAIVGLILYEPPFPVDGPAPPAPFDMASSALRAGDARAALTTLLREIVGLRPEELDVVRQLPDTWFESFAASALREMTAVNELGSNLDRFADIRMPTLLLLGTESTGTVVSATRRLAELLPDARVATLEGQAHNAVLGAPQMLASHVKAFLDSTWPPGPQES
jgi:pimeloyl-ACP methyl ester carboxylesterase